MRKTLFGMALGIAAITCAEREARACGGCFVPTEATIVNDHRMVFAISKKETVLWDQIRYSGAPEEFAWVLPVQRGTDIELSRDEWIAALDASTQPVIQGPPPPETSRGIGCSSTTEVASLSDGAGRPAVQVVSEKVVGPYQTVILRSEDPQALRTFLRANGYAIPASIEPVIDAYTRERLDFAALRLRPGQDVRSMKPVRVLTPGADPTLPLRMVAAGVGANVGLTLYVISEGRYRPQNFPEVTIDDRELVWDTNQARSNYQDLSLAKMAENDGRSWLVEYANKPQLNENDYSGTAGAALVNNRVPGLADAYFSSCRGQTETVVPDAGSPPDAGDDAGDAGQELPPPLPVERPLCAGFDDLTRATKSLSKLDVWVTRLRANLPVNALAEDLRLEASPTQTAVSNVHNAAAPEEDDGCAIASVPRRRPIGTAFTVLALALAARLARKRRTS